MRQCQRGMRAQWFEFTEGDTSPGLFDIVTNAPLSEDILEYFNRMLRRVKNERSHLRQVRIEKNVRASPRVGCGAYSYVILTISNGGTETRQTGTGEYNGSYAHSFPSINII